MSRNIERVSNPTDDLAYLTGYGNHLRSEAVAGAVPDRINGPKRPAHGLFPEQINGTGFTFKRSLNLRSWLYRLRPAVTNRPFTRLSADEAPPRERARLLERAAHTGRKLGAWGDNGEFYAALIGVGVLAGTGKRDAARPLLDRAEASSAVAQSGLLSGCLRCLRAHYFGGPEDMAAAYAALGALGMADPKRWLRTWVSLLGQR